MIPPRDHAASIDDAVADKVRLRIKEQDKSARNIDVRACSGYIIAAWDRPALFDENSEEFQRYLRSLGFHAEEGVVHHYRDGDQVSNSTYNGDDAFVQVVKARESF